MASRPSLNKLGELDVIEMPSSQTSKGLVICLHGYGADCYDLLDLSSYLDPKRNFDWVFPNGPLQVPIGPHMYGRGWFSIDIVEMQKAIEEGRPRDMDDHVPTELKSSVSKVRQIVEMKKRPWSEVVLMGFSQGAMMTMELGLNASANPKAICLLSGALINKAQWEIKIPNRKGQRYFQSHGVHDPILPVQGADRLQSLIKTAGWEGAFYEFQGGHEIPMDVLKDLQSFFKSLL